MRPHVILLALALLMPLAAANPGDGYRPDEPGKPGDDGGDTGDVQVPDMPDQSVFGLCTAWKASETGREHGNVENAGPFVWLQQRAEENDMSVEEWCDQNAPGSPP